MSADAPHGKAILSQPYRLEYPYRRSLGPVIGRFLSGLRDARIEGVRTATGKVIVPPTEYDPETGDPVGEAVEVGQVGTVVSWTWIAAPRKNHPLQHPFAFALIRLDGADTSLLHVIDGATENEMKTGMRVRVRWSDTRTGSIRDIACFEPDCSSRAPVEASVEDSIRISNGETGRQGGFFSGDQNLLPTSLSPCLPVQSDPGGMLRSIKIPVRLDYTIVAGRATSRFLRGIESGKLLGQRCPACAKVYMPPRGACPTCGVPTEEEVEVADSGTVTTFCIVNVPFENQSIPIPYVCASILLDGADTSLFHLIQGIPVAEARMGLRVKAVWASREELKPTLESIAHFIPNGQPDAPYASYARSL